MGHCINIFILKEDEIIDDGILSKTLLNQGFYQVTPIDDIDINSFCKNECLLIETDYFGGNGEQYATYYKNGNILEESNSINMLLKKYGVVCVDNVDEFDTLNLGNYRSNYDFNSNSDEVILETNNNYNCIICDKKVDILLDESISDKDDEKWYLNGTVQKISIGYGSNLDGDQYYICICDECLKNKKEANKIKYIDNYIFKNRW